MFLDDLKKDGVDVPRIEEFASANDWLNRVFWTWYFLHHGDSILRFSVLGINLKSWKFSDLYEAFVNVFGPQPEELRV
jgi:hypothetical protein